MLLLEEICLKERSAFARFQDTAGVLVDEAIESVHLLDL